MFLVVSRFLVPKGFSGITLFPFVFFRERRFRDDAVFVNHERIHLRQQIELLILPFFVWYGVEFLVRLMVLRDRNKAYRAVSFEREAYENEKDLSYLEERPFWRFLRFL